MASPTAQGDPASFDQAATTSSSSSSSEPTLCHRHKPQSLYNLPRDLLPSGLDRDVVLFCVGAKMGRGCSWTTGLVGRSGASTRRSPTWLTSRRKRDRKGRSIWTTTRLAMFQTMNGTDCSVTTTERNLRRLIRRLVSRNVVGPFTRTLASKARIAAMAVMAIVLQHRMRRGRKRIHLVRMSLPLAEEGAASTEGMDALAEEHQG